jgi:hypothetical protein
VLDLTGSEVDHARQPVVTLAIDGVLPALERLRVVNLLANFDAIASLGDILRKRSQNGSLKLKELRVGVRGRCKSESWWYSEPVLGELKSLAVKVSGCDSVE